MGGELGRVHEDGGGDHVCLLQSELHEAQVPGVQRTHGRHEGDPLALRLHLAAPVAGFGPCAGDHQSVAFGQYRAFQGAVV